MKKKRWLRVVVTVLGVLALIQFIIPDILLLPKSLLTGWIFSLIRLARAWQPQPQAVGWFAAAVMALIIGSHLFARWLCANTRPPHPPPAALPTRRQWRWKWTLGGWALVACAWLMIVSAVLTVHQTYWMSRGTAPWLVPLTTRSEFRADALSLEHEAEFSHWNEANIRAAYWRSDWPRSREALWEHYQLLRIESNAASPLTLVLIPRRPLLRDTAEFAVIQPGKATSIHKLDDLGVTLASFGLRYRETVFNRHPALLP